MPQKITLFTVLFFASTVVLAQSTCQTRVDAHQKATTPQRVEYCLTQDAYPAETVSNPELIYAQVSSHNPVAAPKQKEYTPSNPYFDENKYTVMQGYVGTSQFPVFQNSIMSEQELAAQRKAWLEREAALNQANAPLIVRQAPTAIVAAPGVAQPTVTKPVVAIAETKSGLVYRSHKPGRVMKQKGLVEESQVTTTSVTTTTVETKPAEEPNLTSMADELALPAASQSTTETTTTVSSTTAASVSLPETKSAEDALGGIPDNPYAQPVDLTNTDETIPYGGK